MSKEILGHITCPLCGNEHATVHRQAKGSKALYFRCYDGENGACGTIQCILSGGQHFINNNMRPLNSAEATAAAEQAAIEAKVNQQKAAEKAEKQSSKTPNDKPKNKGLFSGFLEDSIA